MLRIRMRICPEAMQRPSGGPVKAVGFFLGPVCSSKPHSGSYWNPEKPKLITQIKKNANSDFKRKVSQTI